jgi:hypothetical protein
MMAHHDHEAFKALAPIDWSDISQERLSEFLTSALSCALSVVDSIPHTPTPTRPLSIPVPYREKLDDPTPERPAARHGQAQTLRREWKEVRVAAKDNPLGISVYKLGAQDGKGSWFARRSVHEGVTFEKWRLGLEREFAETMKVKGGAGSGSIRGIGAERRVEVEEVDGLGKLECKDVLLTSCPLCGCEAIFTDIACGSVPTVRSIPGPDYPSGLCHACAHLRAGGRSRHDGKDAEVIHRCLEALYPPGVPAPEWLH